MKALTLTQPWAALVALVALGEKRYETRSWGTSYRGPLAIHAAKGWPAEDRDDALWPPFRPVLARHYGDDPSRWPLDAQRGHVLATCRLVEVVRISAHLAVTQRLQELDFGDWTPGRFAWRLEDVRPLAAPVLVRGALGLWEWNDGGCIAPADTRQRVLAESATPTRVVNLHREPYDVYIGRAGKGQDGYFGNPYTVREHGQAALRLFGEYFGAKVDNDPEFRRRVLALRGRTLGCFCKPRACHGDVLVRWLDAQQDEARA